MVGGGEGGTRFTISGGSGTRYLNIIGGKGVGCGGRCVGGGGGGVGGEGRDPLLFSISKPLSAAAAANVGNVVCKNSAMNRSRRTFGKLHKLFPSALPLLSSASRALLLSRSPSDSRCGLITELVD